MKKSCLLKLLAILVLQITCVFSYGEEAEKVFRMSTSFAPKTLDPVYATSTPDVNISVNFFEGLYTTNVNGEYTLGQAKKISVSDDGLKYTFTLRDDIYWSDGRPVIADDFYWSIKRLMDPKVDKLSKPIHMLGILEGSDDFESKDSKLALGVKVINDKTIQYTTKRRIHFYKSLFAYPSLGPIPSHVLNSKGEDWSNSDQKIVSNGPYVYHQTVDQAIIGVKNKYYYDVKNVYFDKFIAKIGLNRLKTMHEFNTGKIDIINRYVMDPESSDRGLVEGSKVAGTGYKATTYMAVNQNRPAFKDKRVGQALSMAIFRKELSDRLPGLGHSPSYTFAAASDATGWKKYKPEWASWSKEKRLSEARKLMNLAGYNEDNRLKLELSTFKSGQNLLVINAIKIFWFSIFVDAKTVEKETGRIQYSDLDKGNYDIGRAAWMADFDDPSNFLSLLSKNSAKNYANWVNSEYDDLLGQYLKEESLVEGNKILKAMEDLILEHVPIIPIYEYGNSKAISKNITGVYKQVQLTQLIKHLRHKD